LVNIGGHNPIEAARYGVPVIVGPYTQNISDLVSDMLSQNAIVQVQNASDLPLAVLAALQGELKTVGSNGQRFADGLRGNTGRVFNEVFGAGAES
jgi:3-deoxy-D-manno-octulosonic-acid transferase